MISYVVTFALFSVQTMPTRGGRPADGRVHPEAVTQAGK